MPIARLPTSKLVAALLEQKNTKRRLLRVLAHKYHDPTEQVSRDAFAELVASALAEDCAFSHDELIAAARDVFDTKILASKTLSVSPRDSVSARETLSFYRFGFTAAAGLPEPIGLPESVQRIELATPLRDAARIYERGGLMSPRIARSHGDAALSPRAGAHSPLVLPPDADGLIGPRGPNAKTKVGRAEEEGSAPGAAGRRSPSGPPSTETLLRLVQARFGIYNESLGDWAVVCVLRDTYCDVHKAYYDCIVLTRPRSTQLSRAAIQLRRVQTDLT